MRRVSSETVYEGPIASVRIDVFDHGDGEDAERQVITHPGAVAALAIDDESVWLVRQPREAVGEESTLEVPAGKLDVEGESRLECMQRELSEEIGKRAERWTELKSFYMSPGLLEEEVTVFLAEGLSDDPDHEPIASERIEIAPWPLGEIDAAFEESSDAKSLIALAMLRELLARRAAR